MSRTDGHLNDLQRDAGTWDRGPVLVLAGPGSGKTRVLATRIIRLVEASAGEAFRILGLTFTTKAAAEMRSRVTEQAAPEEQHRVRLTTFHSFCGDILRQHGNHVDVSPDFEVISTKADRREILERAWKATQEGAVPDRFKAGKFQVDVGKLLDHIDNCFESLLSEEEIRQAPKDAEWGGVFASVVRRYREELVSEE